MRTATIAPPPAAPAPPPMPQPKPAPKFGGASTVYNVIDTRQSYLQDVVVAGLRQLGFQKQADQSVHFGYEMVALYALAAPLQTPAAIIDQLNQIVVQSLRDAELKERFLVSGMEAQSSSPAALAARIQSEIATVSRLVKSAGIRAE